MGLALVEDALEGGKLAGEGGNGGLHGGSGGRVAAAPWAVWVSWVASCSTDGVEYGNASEVV